MQENKSKKKGWDILVLRIFAALICFTLLSSHVVSGIWANYASRGESVTGAKVAVFRVDAQGSSSSGLKQSIKSDTSGDVTQYIVQITNESQTNVYYDVEIEFADSMGRYFTAWLNGARSNSLRWTNVGELAVGETVDCTLEIKVRDAEAFANALMQSNNGASYSDSFDFETFVTFTQIN